MPPHLMSAHLVSALSVSMLPVVIGLGGKEKRIMLQVNIRNTSYTLDHVTTDLMTDRRNSSTSRHSHPVFHLMFVTAGEGRFYVNDMEYVAAEGHLFIINPDEPHYFFFNPQTPMTNYESTFLFRNLLGEPAPIHFFDWLESSRGLRPSLESFSTRLSVPPHMRSPLLESYHRILSARAEDANRHYLATMLLELIMRVEDIAVRLQGYESQAAVRTEATAIATVKQHLRRRLDEKILLQELAELVHLNPNYLCTLFKERTGSTPMGYLQHLRITEAEKLLSYTDLPIYRIAESTGFEQATYFTKVFRKAVGLSPSDYRRHMQQKPDSTPQAP